MRCRTAMPGGPTWARERLNTILAALGDRAKKSIIRECYNVIVLPWAFH